MANWHYVTPSRDRAEVDDATFRELVKSGEIRPDTLVWTEGIGDWKSARMARPDLFPSDFKHPLPTGHSIGAAKPVSTAPERPDPNDPLKASPEVKSSRRSTSVPENKVDAPPAISPGDAPASGKSVASLVCGILGLLPCSIFGAFPAVICGHLALREINDHSKPVGGRGFALAGLAMGYFTLVFTLLAVVVYFVVGLSLRLPADGGGFPGIDTGL